MTDYEFSNDPVDGMTIYSPAYLASLPTIAQGQADDLKVETGTLRYWLSRCGPEDGQDYEVEVERLEDGRWQPLLSYRRAGR